MNSLEWRTKKLEDKIRGESVDFSHDTILNQLSPVAEFYASSSQHSYSKFKELHEAAACLLDEKSESTKVDLVLAYEEDLLSYMHDLKLVCHKAESVLDPQKWPDSSKYKEKLEKLTEINKEQFSQSTKLDERVEELIGIYNEIINSFRSNMKRWDQMLEASEQSDRKSVDNE